MNTQKHILAVWSKNTPGVLSRIAGLLRRKLFNIDSLTVGRTSNPKISRFTIVIAGKKEDAQKAAHLIERLIDILKVELLAPSEAFKREIVLARIVLKDEEQQKKWAHIKENTSLLLQEVIANEKEVVVELVDKSQNLEEFLAHLHQEGFEIKDWVRSGVIALKK